MAFTKVEKENEKTTAPSKESIQGPVTGDVVPQPMLQPGETHEHLMQRTHEWANNHDVVSHAVQAQEADADALEKDEKRSDTEAVDKEPKESKKKK